MRNLLLLALFAGALWAQNPGIAINQTPIGNGAVVGNCLTVNSSKRLGQQACGGGGGSISLTATLPIVITPSPTTNTGVISGPTVVVGPGSATSGHIATFNGTTGKLIQDGGAVPTGTVTSVTLVGTTNQVTVTGTCTVTTTGTCTFSLPASLVLPTGTTGTTQAANDNSTKIATTAYADRAASSVGTVTSVVLAGTSNQITVTGTCTITSSGTCTFSLPANLILPNGTTATTQSAGDNTTKAATDAFVTTAVANAIAGVNPAIAVQACTAAAGDTSGFTYNNGVSGVGAFFTGSVNTAITIDGFTFTALGQRLLVKNDTQSPSGAFNGVYYVTTLQASLVAPVLTRALDYDQPSDINNTGAIPCVNGTANASTSWLLTSAVATVGTDPLTYTKFSLNPSTLVTAVSPGVGIAHFAGSTQAVTSSAIVAADITNATITGTQLASSVALAGNPTTTTQTALDNSTKIATTAYVNHCGGVAGTAYFNVSGGVISGLTICGVITGVTRTAQGRFSVALTSPPANLLLSLSSSSDGTGATLGQGPASMSNPFEIDFTRVTGTVTLTDPTFVMLSVAGY